MKKVLYISNIEVPYRSTFFNMLSEKIDLTVLYERKKSSNRNSKWASSVKSNYNVKYLKGINIKNEYTFDLRILKYVFSKEYDKVIIGCCNSPSQMLAIILMKLFKKKYILNLDGEYFLDGNSLKKRIKRFFVKGADKYLIAGEVSAKNLSKYVPSDRIFPYYFSSLTKKELFDNSKKINKNINDKVLVVGQYFDYKGLDKALELAKLDQSIKYKFIGSGNRSYLLEEKIKEMKLNNVEVIPFLQKEDLYKEFQECLCLLLPSKQECWGLVINEAASFGCPIVSSNKVGASCEFLYGVYDEYLFDFDNMSLYEDILDTIKSFLVEKFEYKTYLLNRSNKYSIESSVDMYYKVLGECYYENKN